MNHRVFGRKLSRTKNQRRRLFQSLVRSLVMHDQVHTTLAKAKAVQPLIEELITKAKSGTQAKKREVFAVIADDTLVSTLWDKAKTQFSVRSSGYTRIIKLGTRRGDHAEAVMLSFVDGSVAPSAKQEKAAVPKLVAEKPEKPKLQRTKKTKAKTA